MRIREREAPLVVALAAADFAALLDEVRHAVEGRPVLEFTGIFHFLSNFEPAEVELDGLVYPSVEHAFQAAKTTDPEMRRRIRSLPATRAGCAAAKRLGKALKLTGGRSAWDARKVGVMRDLLRKKFQHERFRALLLATGDARLVEGNWWNDRFWGVCRGYGENWLGRLLMELRAEIRREVS